MKFCNIKKYVLSALFVLWVQAMFAMPRLTVVMVVDGLTVENLELIRKYLAPGGLRTMCEEATMPTFTYPHLVYGGNECVATLMTGKMPSNHAIVYNDYFRREDRKIHHILEDDTHEGIGTDLKISPRSIASVTLTDEVRMKYGEKSKIYSVGIDPTTTVILAGHGADACCWIGAKQQKWVTTDFYPQELPASADSMNQVGQISTAMAERWVPLMSMPMYSRPTKQEIVKPYNYLVGDVIKRTPQANSLVVNLALDIQQKEQMGLDNIPDLLLLHLNLVSPQSLSDKIVSAEQEDMYLRFNKDLGNLMEQLNKRVGKAQYRIVMIGKPVYGRSVETLQMSQIETKKFNLDKAIALTSVYLSALYGNKKWILGGHLQSVFLNRTLIEQEGISLLTLQDQVATFLMEFEGVKEAYPVGQISCTDLAPSICYKKAGDVCFLLQENWQLYENDKKALDYVIESDPVSPIMFWGAGYKPQSNQMMIATDIKNIILK